MKLLYKPLAVYRFCKYNTQDSGECWYSLLGYTRENGQNPSQTLKICPRFSPFDHHLTQVPVWNLHFLRMAGRLRGGFSARQRYCCSYGRASAQVVGQNQPTWKIIYQHFQPANWQPLMKFLRSAGLRRQELRDLHVRDIYRGHDGHVYVENGKGDDHAKYRRCQDTMKMSGRCVKGVRTMQRCLSGSRVTWVHSVRREFAQALYLHYAPGQNLPPAEGRLKRKDYDRAAAERVTWALGHNRIDVVLRHYIR